MNVKIFVRKTSASSGKQNEQKKKKLKILSFFGETVDRAKLEAASTEEIVRDPKKNRNLQAERTNEDPGECLPR